MNVCDRCLAIPCRKILVKIDKVFRHSGKEKKLRSNAGRPLRMLSVQHQLCGRCSAILEARMKLLIVSFIKEGVDEELQIGEQPHEKGQRALREVARRIELENTPIMAGRKVT